MPWRTLFIILGVSVACWIVIMMLLSLLSRKPELGPLAGRLRPCPESPNCVCSEGGDEAHSIPPLVFEGDASAAWGRLRLLLERRPRTRIAEDEPGYLRAECTSLLFRFVDDVEFLLDEAGKRINVRSASRAGRSDLGVNRARVESLRTAFQAQGP